MRGTYRSELIGVSVREGPTAPKVSVENTYRRAGPETLLLKAVKDEGGSESNGMPQVVRTPTLGEQTSIPRERDAPSPMQQR